MMNRDGHWEPGYKKFFLCIHTGFWVSIGHLKVPTFTVVNL